MKAQRLAVASVCLANVHPKVMLGLSSNLFFLAKNMPNIDVVECIPERYEVSTARNLAIELALHMNFDDDDFFFWLDDDTVLLEKNILLRMVQVMKENKDIDMLSPSYYVRTYPFKTMAFKEMGLNRLKMLEEGEEEAAEKKDGIIRSINGDKIIALGNGCTIMRMGFIKLMEKSRTNREWYRTGKHHTEDVFFCAKAKSVKHDFQCAIDTTITASHLLGTDWVDANNKRYKKLKFELACALNQDESRYEIIEKLLEEWKPNLDLLQMPLFLDNSLGRM